MYSINVEENLHHGLRRKVMLIKVFAILIGLLLGGWIGPFVLGSFGPTLLSISIFPAMIGAVVLVLLLVLLMTTHPSREKTHLLDRD